jgi:hypothetical protein
VLNLLAVGHRHHVGHAGADDNTATVFDMVSPLAVTTEPPLQDQVSRSPAIATSRETYTRVRLPIRSSLAVSSVTSSG